MLRFLTENGRIRSNSRQLSEILFFVKLKHQRKEKRHFRKLKPFLKKFTGFWASM
jgi:hypothetical protein